MWHLTRIPRIAHFYWGGSKLSYLRFLSVKSFQQYNLDWTIKIHVPEILSNAKPSWDTFQQKNVNIKHDYFGKLADINGVTIVKHNFSDYDFDNNAHEVHKSDFLRWHLLAQHGGLWSDIDILYTAPMSFLIENTDSNHVIDTALCPLKPPHKHTVGFMLSSQGNNFFQYISELARTAYDPATYQCMGSDLINERFKTFDSFVETFTNHNFIFLNKNCVYPVTSKNIDCFYQEINLDVRKKINHKNVVGYHWFAGHPLSQAFENEFTADNIDKYNNLLTTVIKESQVEACN
jgi:hypothetical protein